MDEALRGGDVGVALRLLAFPGHDIVFGDSEIQEMTDPDAILDAAAAERVIAPEILIMEESIVHEKTRERARREVEREQVGALQSEID